MSVTHYIPAFTVNGPGGQQALCGDFVSMNLFSTEPSCEQCREALAEGDRTAAVLEQIKATNRSPAVPVDFDPCEGYRPRPSRCFVSAEDFYRHFQRRT